MAVVVFDSSALVKLVVDEEGSETVVRLWDEASAVVASRLAHPEVRAALSAAERAGRITAGGHRAARADWEEYWAALRVVEMTALLAGSAADLTLDHVLGGADAVHLASALALQEAAPILATWDRRLWTAARAAGLVVAPTADSLSGSDPPPPRAGPPPRGVAPEESGPRRGGSGPARR